MYKLFEGVKTLELCQTIKGAYCAKILAQLGAEVVKIEQPKTGDPARQKEPFLDDLPHPEKSGLFLYLNTSKLGITLDLNCVKGQKLFKELIKGTDILIEDTKPGTMENFGLGYENLKSINPKLIMTSITPFGQTGPHRHHKAYPLNNFHSGGEGYLTPSWMGYLERPPLKAGKYVGDYVSGIGGAVATLGGLFWQGSSGLGQHVDVSCQEILMQLNSGELMAYPNFGLLASRATRVALEGGFMPCKDGYVELAIYTEIEWEALIKLMGNPGWVKEEIFENRISRREHGKEVYEHVSQWMKLHTKDEICVKGQALGCPVASYCTTEEVVNSPQRKARGFFTEISHPEAGDFFYPSVPYIFPQDLRQADFGAPLLGQHNQQVYGHRLGYSKKDLVKLRDAGII